MDALPHSSIQRISSRYILGDSLGTGGMGTVYRAFDRLTGQTVALKRVLTPVESLTFNTRLRGDGANFPLMLMKEFQTLASLRHPNVISVLDYGLDEEKQPYFTLEYVDSHQTILEYGSLKPLPEQIDLLVQLLRALAYLHRRGVLHRDIKPANVLVNREGSLKVLDFGLSHTSDQTGQQGGTLNYMAPEVLLGDEATPAADLYAVGVIAYELFAGRYLYENSSVNQLIQHILYQQPDLLQLALAQPVKDVMGRLLEKDMRRRYTDAAAVIRDLQIAIGKQPTLETSSTRESFLQAARFVGRDRELGELADALDTQLDHGGSGVGTAWLIGGESGVGKSRLLNELRVQALVKGATVLWGQALEGTARPFEPWAQVLRRLVLATPISDLEASILKQIVPDIAALLERPVADPPMMTDHLDRQHLITTVIDMFRRQTAPVVLVFEDVQWFFESLEPLRWLSEYIHELPMLLLCSFRSDERPDLPALLPNMRLMPLERLSREAVEQLTVSMLGSAGYKRGVLDLIESETEGNSFFIIEVVRALAESVGSLNDIGTRTLPHSVISGGLQEIIARRLDHIPVEAQPLLRLAAVAGRWLDLAVLRQLAAGISLEDWLTVGMNAAVLDVHEGRYRFAHDKLRQAILLSIPGTDVPEAHRQVAEAIERAYPRNDSYAAILADHWYIAGDTHREASYARIAGLKLYRLSEFQSAVSMFQRALALADTPLDRLWVEKALGDAHEKLGEYDHSIRYFTRCIHGAQTYSAQPDAQRALGDALNGLGEIALKQGHYTAADDHFQRGYTIHQAVKDRSGMGHSLLLLGMSAYNQGQYALAKPYLQQSLGLFRDTNNFGGAANSLNNLGYLSYLQGDYSSAQEYYRQSMMMCRSVGDRWGVASTLNHLGTIAHLLEDHYTAHQYLLESYLIQKEIGDRWGAAASQLNLGDIAVELDDAYDAQQHFKDCLKARRTLDDQSGVVEALVRLSALHYRLNEFGLAWSCLTQAFSIARNVDNDLARLNVILGFAWSRLYAGLPVLATYLLHVVTGHPRSPQSLARLIQKLEFELESQLSPVEMALAAVRGRAMSVADVMTDIAAELDQS